MRSQRYPLFLWCFLCLSGMITIVSILKTYHINPVELNALTVTSIESLVPESQLYVEPSRRSEIWKPTVRQRIVVWHAQKGLERLSPLPMIVQTPSGLEEVEVISPPHKQMWISKPLPPGIQHGTRVTLRAQNRLGRKLSSECVLTWHSDLQPSCYTLEPIPR